MTLPTNITLPIDQTAINSGNPQDLLKYVQKLIYVLSTFIQQSNQSANGSITSISDTTVPAYPFIIGSTGAGTATYSNTVLWYRRSNLVTQIWFDITWSGHTGTGNLLIQVPYNAQPSLQFPFVGTIESDSMTYTAHYTYLTANILPGTNTIQVNQNGSGEPIIPLPIASSGHLRGSITYVGQQFN